MTEEVYEITIIGGGPAGLFGSFYAGMRAAKTKIIEAADQLGGIMVTDYPDEVLRDVAGFTLISARALALDLIRQMEIYSHTICLEERVTGLQHDDKADHWVITTDKDTHYSRTIVLGLGDYNRLVEKNPDFGKMMKDLKLKVDKRGIVVDENMCTNLPGVFACGDIISKDDDLKRITPANAEAAIAVNNAVKYCRPNATAFPGYSTDVRKTGK